MLIVEDEKWEREGLIDFIDWNDFGIEIAGTARDGIEGYDEALRLKPDIILTDIKMPGMDGLEMSKKIKEVMPDTKIIILTGYDDFKYAQEAIRFSASAYILKPFEENELIPVIRKVVDLCNKELEKKGWERKVLNRLSESRKAEKLSFLFDWISGAVKEEELHWKLKEFDIHVNPDGRYAVALVKGFSGPAEKTGISELLAEKAGIDDYLFTVENAKENEVIICWEAGKAACGMHDGCFSDTCEEYGRNMVIGIGEQVSPYNLHISYNQAKEAVKHQIFWNDFSLFRYGDIHKLQENFMEKANEFLVHGDYFSKQFILAVSSANETRVSELLKELFDYINGARGAGTDFIISFIKNIVNDIYVFIYTLHSNFTRSYLYEKTWSECTLNDLKNTMDKFLINVLTVHRNRLSYDEQTVRKVIEIIESRYMEPLSIKTIANEVFLSPNYLGSIFRHYTGKRFNEYLNEYRMEKAKELLKSPKNRVASVAAMVGFQNTSYFCLVFKNTYGIAPGEYQRNHAV